MKLTVAKIRKLKPGSKPYMVNDGKTLNLLVKPTGAKSWVQRVHIDGKPVSLGLGPVDLVSLAEARDQAIDNRRLILRGGDPREARRKTRIPTFAEVTAQAHESMSQGWKSEKDSKAFLSSIERYAFPAIGKLRIDRIGREDILKVLLPHWQDRGPTMAKVRSRVRAILDWAIAHSLIDGDNPAGESLTPALPKQSSKARHFRALPYAELPAALELIADCKANIATRLAFRFMALTATRSGETRGATWDEIDLDAALWEIPASRMKQSKSHVVPLSAAALDVLKEAEALADGSGIVFPSPMRKGRPLSDMALTKLLRDVGLAERTTAHGMRTCFRSWGSERTTFRPDVLEMCLSHQVGGLVERSYNRAELIDQRRAALDSWSRFITAESGKVVQIHAS